MLSVVNTYLCRFRYHKMNFLIKSCDLTLILACYGGKQDIVIIVDNSGSIRDNNPKDGSHDNWKLVLNFVTGTVENLINHVCLCYIQRLQLRCCSTGNIYCNATNLIS